MKAAKFIAVTLAIVTVLLVAGWILRNTIIERISNPLLKQYGLTVTDVSLDALATSNASISYLELEHTNGATIAIYRLTLPIGTSPTGFKRYSAERIRIDLPERADDAPLELALMIAQLLALPLQLPRTEFALGELGVPPYPVIRDLRWRLTQNNQKLSALVDSYLLTAIVDRISDTGHILNLSIAEASAASADQSITMQIERTDSGMAVIGTATIDLPRWAPVSTMLGYDAVGVEAGSADLRFEGEIADDPNQATVVYADVTPTTPLQVTYARAADAVTTITVKSASTIEISATLPEVQWSLRQAEASLLVTDGDWKNIPVSLINLSCRSGTICSSDIGIVMDKAVTPFAKIGRFAFAATQQLTISDDGMKVLVQPNASLDMRGISTPDLELARFKGQLTSTAELDTGDSGWHFKAQSADVDIEKYAVLEDLEFSAQFFLDDISFSNANQLPSLKLGAYASSSRAQWADQLVRLPGFKGGLVRQGAEVAVFLETVGLNEEAGIEANHNLDKESGRLSVMKAGLSFSKEGLASRVTPWRNAWNVTGGTVGVDLQGEWRKQRNTWHVTGQAAARLARVAGTWDETAFAGLTTTLAAAFDTAGGITIQPSSIEVALVDIGLPLRNITAGYALQPDNLSVRVENLRMTAFGGVITADPFSFGTANERNTLLIHAASIDLAEVLSIKDFEAIEVRGSIAAELPVTIEGQTVTIDGGRLTGEPPGGIIRYLPGLGGGQPDASGIGVATRALSNFEYETLTSEVDYTADGDLKLQMRLTGRNPDLESKRPVILNLGLENNVPQMLRSLQAARAVEDILEKRLAQ